MGVGKRTFCGGDTDAIVITEGILRIESGILGEIRPLERREKVSLEGMIRVNAEK